MLKNRTLLKIGMLILIAGLLVITPTGLQARPLDADWTGWGYAVPVRVTNNSAGQLPSGYTVSLQLDTAALVGLGHLRSDCADLRISYAGDSEDVELDRLVSGCNTAATSIRFKTQTALLAGGIDGEYILHYGKSDAGAPPSNPQNVLAFYDDFQDGNADGWNAAKGTWGVVDDGGNYVYRYTGGGASWAISYPTLADASNLEIFGNIRAAANTNWIGFAFRIQDANNFLTFYQSRDTSDFKFARVLNDQHDFRAFPDFTMAAGTWYSIRIQAVGSQVRARIWPANEAEPAPWTFQTTETAFQTSSNFGATLYYHDTNADWDDIQVRKLVDVEPTVETYELVPPITDWIYRAPVDVTNTSATATLPVRYTVLLEVDTAALIAEGQMAADCQDLQVGSAQGADVYEIDRVVENCNTAATRVWFALQRPVAPGGHDAGYYLYYGDPTPATPLADEMKVFLFFEDFEQTAAHWTGAGGLDPGNTGTMGYTIISSESSVSASNSQKFPTKASGGDAFSGYIPVDPDTTYAISVWAKSAETTYAPVGIDPYTAVYVRGAENWLWTSEWSISPNWTWRSGQFTTNSTTAFIKIKSEWWSMAPGNQPVYMDNLGLRYAIANEPSLSLGAEETTLAAPTITNVLDNGPVNLGGNLTVTAQVQAAGGSIDSVILRIVSPLAVDVPMSLHSGTNIDGTWQGEYTPPQGGELSYRVRAHATNGSQSTTPLHTFTVTDTTPPVISDLTFTSTILVNSTQTVSVNVSDNGAVSTVNLTVGGATYPMTRSGSQFSYSWLVTTVGDIPFTVTATDSASNQTSLSDHFVSQARPVEVCTWKDCKTAASSWSIDDGNTACRTELEAAGFRGTYYYNGSSTLSWFATYSAAGHEVASHTVGHLCNAPCCFPTCTPESLAACPYTPADVSSYRQDQLDPNIAAIEAGTGKPVLSLAWPCGCVDPGRQQAASFYYLGARGYYDHMALLSWVEDINLQTPVDFLNLNSAASYRQDFIDRAIAEGKWAITTSHGSCAGIDYMGSRSDMLWNAPVGEVLKYINVRNAALLTDYSRVGRTITFDAQHSLSTFSRSQLDGTPLLPIVYDNPVSLKVHINDTDAVQNVAVNGATVSYQVLTLSGARYVVFDAPLNTVQNVVITLAAPLPAIVAIDDDGPVELGDETQISAIVTLSEGTLGTVTLQVLSPEMDEFEMTPVAGQPDIYAASFTPGLLSDYTYRVRATNDTGGVTLSSIQTLNVVDTTDPIYRSQAQTLDNVPQNRANTLSAEGLDIGGLEWATLMTDESGSWQEFTWPESNWWNFAWQRRIPVTVSETAGLARTAEMVDVTLSSATLEGLTSCAAELRVADGDKNEIPAQVYDESDSGGVVSCHLLFQASVGANASKTYYIYYNNPAATAPSYTTDLTSSTAASLITVGNSSVNLDLNTASGIISRVRLPQGTNTNLPLAAEGNSYWGWHQVCSSLHGNITGKNGQCQGGAAPASGLALATLVDGSLVKEYEFTKTVGTAVYTVRYRFIAGAPYYQYSLARSGTEALVMNNFWYLNGNFGRLGAGTGSAYNTYSDGADLVRMHSFATVAVSTVDGTDNDGTTLGGAAYTTPTASGLALNVVTGTDQAAIATTLAKLAAPLSATIGAAVEEAPEPVYGSPARLNGASDWSRVSFTWMNSLVPVGTEVQWRIRFCDVSGNCGETDTMSFWIEQPTAVMMGELQVTHENDRVLIEWSTALEIDLIGFNVYRAESETGERTRLNPALIPGSGEMTGSTYRFVDENVQRGKTYYYWIEWVGLEGGGEVYGPAQVLVTTPLYLPLLVH